MTVDVLDRRFGGCRLIWIGRQCFAVPPDVGGLVHAWDKGHMRPRDWRGVTFRFERARRPGMSRLAVPAWFG